MIIVTVSFFGAKTALAQKFKFDKSIEISTRLKSSKGQCYANGWKSVEIE